MVCIGRHNSSCLPKRTAKLELRDQLPQSATLASKARTSRTGLLDHGSVLLRHLAHQVDGGVNLAQAYRLLLGGRGD